MRKSKITFKILSPDEVWHPKIGPPFGSRNALKTGLHTREVRDLRRRIRAFHARVNALLKDVDEQLKNSPSPTRGEGENVTGPHDGGPATTP